MSDALQRVFTAGRIGGMTLPHRVVMGAMHLNLETRDDGGAALAEFYAERARGGAGLIITGGSAVSREGAGGRHYSLVNDPSHHAVLARVAKAVHAEGGRVALQLFHAGRYAPPDAFGITPLAPSEVYSKLTRCTPREATAQDLHRVVEEFAAGARTARELGFDAVEIMGSEGYLINEFLSPATNQRDDAWGGDAARRRRFALDIAREVRAAADGLPVLFRISGVDLVPGAGADHEPADLAVELARVGVDAVDVGIGWHESRVPTVQTVVPPAVWTPYAGAVRAALHRSGFGDVPVIASNRINRLELADDVLAAGDADFVSMARPLLADPNLVDKYRTDRRELVNLCIACNEACIDRSLGDDAVSCLVNPRAGRELEFPEPPAAVGRRYAVLGAGPAGLEAARALGALGHTVELFESAEDIGGQFRMARVVPGKADFGETVEYYRAELARLGVSVHAGRPVGRGDEELLSGFDGVVLATGVLPRRVDIPGAHLPHVVAYPEAFAAPDRLGPRVAVIGGGGIAVDLAHRLTESDPRTAASISPEAFRRRHGLDGDAPARGGGHAPVTLLRRGGRIGSGMGVTTRWAVVDGLRAHGVDMRTGVTYQEIVPDGIRILDDENLERTIPADTVVVAAGQEACTEPLPALEAAGVCYRAVGGAGGADRLNAVRATDEGLRAAHELAGETPGAHVMTGGEAR